MASTDLSIAPGVLQSGTYSAQQLRQLTNTLMTQGVDGSGDYLVAERAAGQNLSVDVAAGIAYVTGTSVADQGTYVCRETGVVNVVLSTADGSNPRIDRVVLTVYDNEHDASGFNKAVVRSVDGTPSAGATLVNLTGAAAVPANSLLLANVLVATSDTTIADADIDSSRDIRAMAVTRTNQPACRLYNSANTSAGDGAWTKVALNTSTHDNGGMGDLTNNRIYARTAGLYDIKGAIHWAGSTAGNYRWAAIYVNGSATAANRGAAHKQSGVKQTTPVVDEVNLAAGDYVELFGYQDTGGALNMLTGASDTWLTLRRVGETA